MGKIIITAITLLTLISCNNNSLDSKNVKLKKPSGLIDSSTAKFDTIAIQVTKLSMQLSDLEVVGSVFIKSEKANANENISIAVPYPPASKKVSWYYIGHAPMGSGMLTVICEDNTSYKVPISEPASIAAISSLLQAKYVRFDTISKEIYSYNSTVK